MKKVLVLVFLALLFSAGPVNAAEVTTPMQQFGFNLGDDYQLANYQQLVAYWKKLEQESSRMTLEQIGETAEGRPMWMAIITSPDNHQRVDEYKQIARRLALARDLTDEQARELASRGKAVVWIDGGLHATEVLGAQQLMELVYQMVSRDDAETQRFLNDVILLAACVNPDGLDLVADWYMREEDQSKRSSRGIPRLYQKYVGHDNNRDFYMVTQPESIAINRIQYREWFPQIAYNHHQSGPAGTVLFAPPFRDPFNYNIDPLVITGLDLVGAAMHGRFVAEGKPGATMRGGASYSTWWNGGLRTTQYFHNIIGLLTETIGNPTPAEIPLILNRQLPKGDLPAPIAPQKWHFRQSVDYSITANRAVLDVASRYREIFLYNIYQMGRKSIGRGSRDHWTVTPERIAAVEKAAQANRQDQAEGPGGGGTRGGRGGRGLDSSLYTKVLQEPAKRDARGYILSADQADFNTAGKFINTLIRNGVQVHRASRSFQVAGKAYPAQSYIIRMDQAFRPHILDMMEPQVHPDDIPYPGGPPTAPYDSAGWTLAYQMGVQFDRILDHFDGPFEAISDEVSPLPGKIQGSSSAAGYVLDPRINDAFVAVNRLLASGSPVYRLKEPIAAGGLEYPEGSLYVPAGAGTRASLQGMATELGLNFVGIESPAQRAALRLRPIRVGLWDRYGGSMPSGWVRWIFEQYEFPFEVVFPPRLDAGDLGRDFDVLVFVGGAIPGVGGGRGGRGGRGGTPDRDSIPAQYHDQLGSVTVDKTVPRLRQFVEQGGSIITIGSSTGLAYHFGLPIENHLIERTPQGEVQPLDREKYYVPGSVLASRVNPSHPLAYGLPARLNVYFNNNPVFRLRPQASMEGISTVAWFDSASPLRSGWAWGQAFLEDGVAVVDAPMGDGRLMMFGPEITFRAQPHGTFKFLFNGLYYGSAEEVTLQ